MDGLTSFFFVVGVRKEKKKLIYHIHIYIYIDICVSICAIPAKTITKDKRTKEIHAGVKGRSKKVSV